MPCRHCTLSIVLEIHGSVFSVIHWTRSRASPHVFSSNRLREVHSRGITDMAHQERRGPITMAGRTLSSVHTSAEIVRGRPKCVAMSQSYCLVIRPVMHRIKDEYLLVLRRWMSASETLGAAYLDRSTPKKTTVGDRTTCPTRGPFQIQKGEHPRGLCDMRSRYIRWRVGFDIAPRTHLSSEWSPVDIAQEIRQDYCLRAHSSYSNINHLV